VAKAYLARYYLRTLELYARGEPQPELVPNTDPGELSLEHVLPERPLHDAWPQFTEDERKAYTKRLGNMVLLKQKMNARLRSASFDVKRPIFGESELLLTKRVADCNEWTEEAIEKRQNYLAELAVNAWKIKPQ
jgi:hypothetical protein